MATVDVAEGKAAAAASRRGTSRSTVQYVVANRYVVGAPFVSAEERRIA